MITPPLKETKLPQVCPIPAMNLRFVLLRGKVTAYMTNSLCRYCTVNNTAANHAGSL